ncbi:ferredoxin [Halosegnis sp.]|uniref:ferredoxin n=1 Tax=Halosegnis sp. TaxID=2864959 RepID=UPI0035D43393
MTTEYTVRLDREACDGIFACLVRDDRFVEAADGIAALADETGAADSPTAVATFDDDRLAAAEDAAAACPLDAIDVEVVDGE